MRSVKGCINKKCITNQKKVTFNQADDYCSKCGDKLYYVCGKCYTQLPDASEKYCVRCLAEKRDRKDRNRKTVGKAAMAAGGVAMAVGGVALKVGKAGIKSILKIK